MANESLTFEKLSRLAITCGGTGGHFYPGLSIAVEAERLGIKVLMLLSGINSAAQSEQSRKAGIETVVLPHMPHPGRPVATARFIGGAAGGYFRASRELKRFAPQALLGMGSFAMTPVLLAAKRRGVPVFLHDGNTVVGKANRWASRLARALGCAYPPVNGGSVKCRYELVGMPVRRELRDHAGISKSEATARINENFGIGFSADTPTVLVIGGSLGAASFNTVFPEAFKAHGSAWQVIHLSGRGKLEDARTAYRGFGGKLLLLDTSSHIDWFMGAADLVFARAGGSTLAELTFFGKPAVLIPYPFAAEAHQQRNAEWFKACGGGDLLPAADLDAAAADGFLRRPREYWRRCAESSLREAKPDAAEKMLRLIEKNL